MDEPSGPPGYPPHIEGGKPRRNDRLIDVWSGVHVVTAMAMGWVMDPFVALVILILYEPLEIFILCPISMRLFDYPFGYESWRNSFSDIVFDAVGVAIGYLGLTAVHAPPFHLF